MKKKMRSTRNPKNSCGDRSGSCSSISIYVLPYSHRQRRNRTVSKNVKAIA